MAAEYVAPLVQTVPVNQNVQFTGTAIGCKKGYVIHRDGSGVFTLRGITDQCRAIYKVSFGGNISIPTGQTPGEISLAISLNGEPLSAATMTVTPAAVNENFNVYSSIFVEVPRCCCTYLAVENISTIPVDVINSNLIIDRVA